MTIGIDPQWTRHLRRMAPNANDQPLYDKVADIIDALEAEVARLTTERDEFERRYADAMAHQDAAVESVRQARAERDAEREAWRSEREGQWEPGIKNWVALARQLAAALMMVEWSGGYTFHGTHCMFCHGLQYIGHKSDCPRQAALAAAQAAGIKTTEDNDGEHDRD